MQPNKTTFYVIDKAWVDLDFEREQGVMFKPLYQSEDLSMTLRVCANMARQQNRELVVADEDGNEYSKSELPYSGPSLNRDSWRDKESGTRATREDTVVNAILKFLGSLRLCVYEKRIGTIYQKGRPDITGCIAGLRFEIEVKKAGEVPTEIQEAWLNKWAEAGAISGVARSVDDVKNLFAAYGVDWESLQNEA